ncbi:MAG: DUF2961 domain-containing protein [Acidobacteriota bacterium]
MSSTLSRTVAVLALSVVLSDFVVGASPQQFTLETALRRLWDLSEMPVLRCEKLRMASSGAVYPGAKDRSEFLYRDSNGDYVLFDAAGPGCLVRYWSALVEEGTRIRFYFDGSTRPQIDMPLKEMFTGQTYPWLAPLVGNPKTSSGGSFSYLPMPFAKGCKVALDRVPSFYQIEALQLGDAEVETFDLQRVERYRPAVEKAATQLQPAPAGPDGPAALATARLLPGQTCTLLEMAGPAVITEVRLDLAPYQPELLRKVLIRGFWEDEKQPSVWSPLGDFFVNAFQKVDFTALPIASTETGFLCRFPMPFERAGRLEIVNEADQPLTLRYRVSHRRLERFPEDWGRFHVRWGRVETRLGEYVRLLESTGTGKFVGMTLNAQGITPWMLEGDEVAWVDGELMPSIHGTGTEDYFNAAWYFQGGPFHLAFHGAPMLELRPSPGQPVRASLYRFHLLDPIFFQERIRLLLEHGQENSMQGSDYSFAVFFYQRQPYRGPVRDHPAGDRLTENSPVLKYLSRFQPWQEAVNKKDRARIISLGRGLLADFQQEGTLNRVRYFTGKALFEAGRVSEAVDVWRSAQDYFGIDHWHTRLCKTVAWLYGGRQGPPPRSLLNVARLNEAQIPGHFDPCVWRHLPVATDFSPGFPDPYYDLAADIQTEVKVAYDRENLYLQAVCWEPQLPDLRINEGPATKFDQKEDALVVCLDTGPSFEDYLLININAKGRIASGLAKGNDVWSGKKPLQGLAGHESVVTLGSDHWKVELKLPLAEVGLAGDLSERIIGLGLIRVRNAGRGEPEVTKWGRGLVPSLPTEFGLARFE